MPVRREFLGFAQSAMKAAAGWLLDSYSQGATVDLDAATVVVPGSRAGRRLLEWLLLEADRRSLVLLPPQIVTAGEVPEKLYEPRKAFADNLTQQLAWVHALRGIAPAELSALVPHPPESDDLEAWLNLGQLLQRLHTELAAEALSFEKVLTRAGAIRGFDEKERWTALCHVQRAYLEALDKANLWDMQTARLFAVEHGECRCTGPLIVLGTVDMNLALRSMLDQVAQNVTALLFAPPDWAARFDSHGCLLPDAWQTLPLPLKTEQIHLADDPSDQARAVAGALAALEGRYRADELLIGVPDPTLVPQLERQLAQGGVAVRWGVGRELSTSLPYRLLQAVAAFVERGRFSDFAALVRHPDVERWLIHRGAAADYLVQLDKYQNEHLPARLSDQWLGPVAAYEKVKKVAALLKKPIGPLTKAKRHPAEWSEPVLEVLRTVYEAQEFLRDNEHEALTLAALDALCKAATALGNAPESFTPRVNAAIAIRWLLSAVGGETVAAPPQPEAIEMLGWLELPWDDSPALVVTTFNEGFVPEPASADPFLPNRLRSALGMWDNARRYARDAYYLAVLCETRAALTLIAGRRDSQHNPLLPSRLFFAADPATAAQRAAILFGRQPSAVARAVEPGEPQPRRTQSGFTIPRPKPLEGPITTLPVTAFRTYLSCPYRFYLRHVLRLAPLSDVAEELDGAAFGSLLHDVLDRFGREEIAASTDAEKIQAFLLDTLAGRVRYAFGSQSLPSVAVQVAQLKARLAAFARWQARWASLGYRIAHTEITAESGSASLLVDELPMGLTGRIDRIDVNERTNEHVIFDYKSSSNPDPPERTHRKRGGQWIDLQLPLYRHLARVLKIDGPVRLGYIALSKDIANVGGLLAEWDDAALDAADETAREVVRRIRKGEFWPPAESIAAVMTDFASICQEGVFDRQLESEEGVALPAATAPPQTPAPANLGTASPPSEAKEPLEPPAKKRSRRREAAS